MFPIAATMINYKRTYCPECGRELHNVPLSLIRPFVCRSCSSVLICETGRPKKMSVAAIFTQPYYFIDTIEKDIIRAINRARAEIAADEERKLSDKLFYRGYFRRRVYEKKAR